MSDPIECASTIWWFYEMNLLIDEHIIIIIIIIIQCECVISHGWQFHWISIAFSVTFVS